MPDYNLSPNMSLPIPIPGVTAAPNYATYLDNSLTIIDQHNHTSGSGVQITPAALNINSALTMQNNSLTNIQALSLFAQSGAPSTNGSLYLSGVDLYYIDGNGNVVRITQSGSVSGASGTITGLPSGTASASFGAGTFVFQSATSTAANIDGGSFILRNGTASSFGITLSPPNALGSNYALVLPTIPAQTNVMTLDNSGNMGSTTWDTVGQNMTATGANAIAATRTRATGTSVGVGGVAISGSSGAFATSSSTPVLVMSCTITTSGRPVALMVQPDGSNTSFAAVGVTSSGSQNVGFFQFQRNSTFLSWTKLQAGANTFSSFPPGILAFVDTPAAGTYTYSLYAAIVTATDIQVIHCSLVAYEL